MDNITYGTILTTKETDYNLSGDFLKYITQIPIIDNIIIEYNQNTVAKYGCTVFACAGALSDLFNYAFTHEELVNLWEEAKKQGASETAGRYFYKAVDLLRNYWNKSGKTKVYSFLVTMGSNEMHKCLERGYSIVCGYRGNGTYNKDKDDNGIVDNTSFGTATYGHCIRIRKDNEKNIYVIDNYVGTEHNTYILKDLSGLLSNNVFYPSGYVFIPTERIPDNMLLNYKKYQMEYKESFQYAIDNLITNGQEKDMYATREQTAVMIARVHKDLSEKLDNLTKLIEIYNAK